MIAHCIGLHGMCTLPNELADHLDENTSTLCMESPNEVIRHCNLPLVDYLLFLHRGCHLISHIFITVFWSTFIFKGEVELF